MRILHVTPVAVAVSALMAPGVSAQRSARPAVIDLWSQGRPAFGVFVPNENPSPPRAPGAPAPPGAPRPEPGQGGLPPRPPVPERPDAAQGRTRPKPLYTKAGAEKLAANPLYDYVFLNLEGSYDGAAVAAMAEGLGRVGTPGRKALIVRVPAFHEDEAAGRARIKEVFAAGADGITFPHVQSVDEARRILAALRAEKINVWSNDNPKGDKLAMLMIEDPGALAQAAELANLPGYSILACGIGSLTQAFGGDRAQGEAGTQKVLAETKRVKMPNMLTATTQDVEKRLKEGFLAILAQGQNPDEAIRIGRAVAGALLQKE
jgi:2-keto-3-deoxy-L-rhamnonate aldolase RhmA